MDILKIIRTFMLYTGTDEAEAQKYHLLIAAAKARLEAMTVRTPETPQEKALMECAAAALAFRDYALINSASETESFTAGDISVKSGASSVGRCQAAEKLCKAALESVSDMLGAGSDFVFMRTRA